MRRFTIVLVTACFAGGPAFAQQRPNDWWSGVWERVRAPAGQTEPKELRISQQGLILIVDDGTQKVMFDLGGAETRSVSSIALVSSVTTATLTPGGVTIVRKDFLAGEVRRTESQTWSRDDHGLLRIEKIVDPGAIPGSKTWTAELFKRR